MPEDSTSPRDDPFSAIEAYVAAKVQGSAAALAMLEGQTDPYSVKRLLLILLEAEEYARAADAIARLPVSIEWADKGTIVYRAMGKRDEAKEMMEFCRESGDTVSWHRCILGYVEVSYRDALKRLEADRSINLEKLDTREREVLHDLVQVAEPIKAIATARGRVDNEVESIVLQFTAHAESLLRNPSEAARLASLLLSRKPMPLLLARMMLARTVPADGTVPDRLRTERPGEFEAQIVAALIEGELCGKPREGWDSARALLGSTKLPAEQLEACKVLLELSQPLGIDYLERTVKAVAGTLPPNDRFLVHARTLLALATDDLKAAEKSLEEYCDESDPQWLQARAGFLVKNGSAAGAVEYLDKAAELVPHPELLRSLSLLAFDNRKFDVARRALERLVSLTPGGKDVYTNLAIVSIRQSDWRNAAQQFLQLRRLEPDNDAHAVNAANALARAGEMQQALSLYNELCSTDSPPLEAVLGRAGLLKTSDRAKEAFDSLKTLKDKLWQNGEFVLAYLNHAYAAGKEEQAHAALIQLRRLQESGAVGPEVLESKTLDDLKEIIHTHHANEEQVSKFVLEGKLPWLVADAWVGQRSPYWSWRVRSQEMLWLFEDPVLLSQRCIYSTNGFSVREADGANEIAEVRCPGRGTRIVADITSVITLDRLGLLDTALEYFGKILYPAVYHDLWLREANHLVPHQPSRINACEAIRRLVEQKRIVVLQPGGTEFPLIHEHTLPEDPGVYYRIQDLLEVLSQKGAISEQEEQKVLGVAHHPKHSSAGHPSLQSGANVAIDSSTLMTLHGVGVLERVLDVFVVHLIQQEYDDVTRELTQHNIQTEVQTWQKGMAERVRQDPRLVEALHATPPEWNSEQRPLTGEEYFAAMFLALQQKLPLMSDDRVTQAFLLNQRRTDVFAAFGTDAVIVALVAAGAINWDRASEAYLTLLAWRYRFVVLPPEVVHAICRQYRQHLPGNRMIQVARYVHECMRDPGLFSGFEPSTIPTTMATRLYQEWIATACEAIALIWMDRDHFAVDQATAATDWIVRELMPTPPKNLGTIGANLARATSKLVFGRLLLKLLKTDDHALAHQCILSVGGNLGLSAADIQRACLEVLNAL